MDRQKELTQQRRRRQLRVRNRVVGTGGRPRLAVFRSSRHIYAQVINDLGGETLVAASSLEPSLKQQLAKGCTKEAAAVVGKALASRALEKGIREVAFDRRHYRFHGRIAALAGAAREGGLQF